MRLSGEGLVVDLPSGWEGGITRNPARSRSAGRPQFDGKQGPSLDGLTTDDDQASLRAEGESPTLDVPSGAEVEGRVRANSGKGTKVAEDGGVVMPVTHLANFALPAAIDVFGTQVVETMAVGDSFLALVEYGPAEVDTPLFERRGLPRAIGVRDFSPKSLNRTIPDQTGMQVFATEAGRAFCLYVVLAGRPRMAASVRDVNAVLSTLEVQPR